MGKDQTKRKTFTNGPRVGAKQNPKKQKAVVAAAEADKLREKGYTIRRNRVHAATPPQRE